ncbi:MAG TPA: class I SAM-dependent methyltransferase family protein, partial [Terriglobales bacterium]|nr:class I SAM-dependent methyltransferase family protein [Terriglobales bacterium]
MARYSEGYRLAATHGPNSGIVAEYAYRNTPRGHGPFGRFLDRQFLHHGAWDAVRQRFSITKDLLRRELQRRRAAGERTTILDVASGTACYLRELLREEGGPDLEVVCRERDPKQV